MQRPEIGAESDSDSQSSDEFSLTDEYFTETEYLRDDSEETFVKSIERNVSSPLEPLAPSQKNLMKTEKEMSSPSNRNVPLLQRRSYEAGPSAAAVQSIFPWQQNFTTTYGRSTSTMKSEWNPTLAQKASNEDQPARTHGSDSKMSIEAEKTFDEPKLLTKPGKDMQLESKRRALSTKPIIPSKTNSYYAQAVAKSVPPRRQTINVSESPMTTTVASAEWKPTPYGNERVGGDQFVSTSGSNSQRFDSEKIFDELLKDTSFKRLALAQKLATKTEEDRQLESQQRITPKVRSNRPSPSLLTRYSPEVWSEAAANSTEQNPPSIPPWRKVLNYKSSTSGTIDSPQPSSKESNESGERAALRNALLASLRELDETAIQDEKTEMFQSSEVTSMVNEPCVTESLSTSVLLPSESKPTPYAKESTDAPVIDAQTQMQPLKFTGLTTIIGNESIESQKILPPESPKNSDHSTASIPTAAQRDILNETSVSGPAQSDHFHNKASESEKSATPLVSPVNFIHPENIGNASIEEKKNAPPGSPKHFVDSTAGRSDALNEASVSGPAPSGHFHDKPIGAEITATPRLLTVEFIHPTNVGDTSIEQTTQQSSKEIELSKINSSAASQSDVSKTAHLSDMKTVEAKPQPVASAIPSNEPSSSKQNVVQTPNRFQATTSGPKIATPTQKRPYKRSNKIQVQSLQQVKPPSVGSRVQPLANGAARINSNQASNIQKNVGPTPIATTSISKYLVKNEAKSIAVNPLKRKNADNLPPGAVVKSNFKLPASNEPKANSTASLKRKNNENLPLHVAAKVQKVENRTQATMQNIASRSTSALGDIAINTNRGEESAAAAGVNRGSTYGQCSENRSFAECIQFLQRNGVTVFKVPQKSSNKVMDKYVKVFQKNNVSVERLNKNNDRA